MTSTQSPEYDMAHRLSAQMPAPQLSRRTSRSSGSQSGYRPARIEKPRSNHNSPRTLERRKTTTGAKRYATLDDHFNMMFGITDDNQADEDQRQPSRPMSWHPSTQSHSASRPSTLVVQTSGQDWFRHSAYGSDFYSLSARSPMYPEQSQNYSYTPSLDEYRGSQDSEYSWQSQQTPSYALSSYSTPTTEPMPWYLREWARKNPKEVPESHSGSTDFLPIQHPSINDIAPNEDENMRDPGKELVALGLYDSPEPDMSWNSGLVEGKGTGLKLAETFQPPEQDEDEEDDANDTSSDEESIAEFSTAKEPTHLPIHMANPQKLNNLDGRSFFFDEDESYTKELYFRQVQQLSMPVPATGLGYGWI